MFGLTLCENCRTNDQPRRHSGACHQHPWRRASAFVQVSGSCASRARGNWRQLGGPLRHEVTSRVKLLDARVLKIRHVDLGLLIDGQGRDVVELSLTRAWSAAPGGQVAAAGRGGPQPCGTAEPAGNHAPDEVALADQCWPVEDHRVEASTGGDAGSGGQCSPLRALHQASV
jgi:hypothetical protein